MSSLELKKNLATILDPQHWEKTPVTCFVSKSYPYAFAQKVLQKIEQENFVGMPRGKFYPGVNDPKQLLPTLQQTILGQSSFFWLGDLDENFTQKQRDSLITGIASYRGENRIAFFVQDVPTTKVAFQVLHIPEEISWDEGLELAQIFNPKIVENPGKKKILYDIFQRGSRIPLNLFMTIADALELVHSKNLPSFVSYINPFLPMNAALSALSQAFFARDKTLFSVWERLEGDYPPVFWLAFWSEQWWRAYHLISFAHKKNIPMAKKMGFRLPYAFINKGWSTYKESHFAKLLEMLYAADYKLKRGHSFCFFDFVYAWHLGNFRAENSRENGVLTNG